jgi:hypothetical protein
VGKDWFADIGETLNGELAEALRLAQLGESLEPDDPDNTADPDDTADTTETSETARRVLEQLQAAETAFAETTDRAATVALDLRHESDFVRVRTQLDVLAEQAPQLRGTDVS